MWGSAYARRRTRILKNKKIKYDTVSFSDGFTVSIPWESTAKGDLADLRITIKTWILLKMSMCLPSMILYLGIEKFLGLLELRDLSSSGLKTRQTDDEFQCRG